jgi:hypothetical protein
VHCWFQRVASAKEIIDIKAVYSEVVVVETLQCGNGTQLGG